MGDNTPSPRTPTDRRFMRPNLRQATLILPRTGERVKRVFTLQSPSNGSASGNTSANEERTPLLGRSNSLPNGDPAPSTWQRAKKVPKEAYDYATSKTGQGILKCSLAYLLGSMATFVPAIAGLLGKNDGKHMVATVTVYFHPFRSAGSMEEATILALVAFCYATFVSFTSMGVSIAFRSADLLQIGHVLVLIIFCGGGLGLVGWVKQRLGNALVNVACSLTSLSIITVLTKEGAVQAGTFSYDKISQVLKMVLMGIFATAAVSLIIRPISARNEFREDLRKVTDHLGDLLTMITRSFLAGAEEQVQQSEYKEASKQYKSVFSSLVKNLSEARNEHYIMGTESEYGIQARLVHCIERLAQDIGGLRSAAATQFNIMKKSSEATNGAQAKPVQSQFYSPFASPVTERTMTALDSIIEIPEENEESPTWDRSYSTLYGSSTVNGTPAAVSEMFTLFVAHLGPPMKSLAYTLREVLDELPFGPAPNYEIKINGNFRSSLVEANELYATARREALTLVYQKRMPSKLQSVEVAADYEEVAASCGYFSSSLQDFAEHMIDYLDILDELKDNLERSPRRRSWNWLLFWRRSGAFSHPTNANGHVVEATPGLIEQNEEQRLSQRIPDPGRRTSVVVQSGGLIPNPMKPTKPLPYTYRLYRALEIFRRDDIKYAIKTGIGAILYGMWSFIPETRPFYSHWRGEWGLLSYMLVCSMTIGASNTTGFHRFLGTCIGALCAVVVWIISDANPFILAFLGWLVSIGCFYIIVGQGKGPMGRFILLTYNLSCLYAYSLSVKDDEDDDDEGGINPQIWEIVLHRVVAVTVGCIWGIIVTRLIWPISARAKLKDGLSVLWLRMSLIWKRDPLSMLTESSSRSTYMDIREATELQRFLSHLEALRKSASSEFELKGPFPDKIFGRLLEATGRMLDSFYAMNVVITKDMKASPGEIEILRHTESERRQLSRRISHLFSVLASSMKLAYPLNDALPNIEHTRDRLLAKIFEFRKRNNDLSESGQEGGQNHATDEDYELLYAYALVTGQLAIDIAVVGVCVEELYGVLDEEGLKLD